MHLQPLIIADASPLIGLAKIGQLELLQQLYTAILIPPAVHNELKPDSNYQGATAIRQALQQNWLIVSEEPEPQLTEPLLLILDVGESEAIALAQQHNAILFIDERKGRNVATKRQIKIIGTGAILLAAKQQKLISNIKEPLKKLEAVGYRLAPALIERLLKMAGEIS